MTSLVSGANRPLLMLFVGVTGLFLAMVVQQAGQTTTALASSGLDQLDPQPVTGMAAPFELDDLGGKKVLLKDFRGRHILLNFWATWCEPCKDELPHLAALADGLRSLPIQIVLVSVDSSFAPIVALSKDLERANSNQRAWLHSAKMIRGEIKNVSVLLDPNSEIASLYGTQKFPETYLIDGDQRLVSHYVGPKPWGTQEIKAIIQKLIQSKSQSGRP